MSYTKYTVLFSCILSLALHPLQAHSDDKTLHADYVVVGVGTAGGLVAKRLSDDKKTSVIALHAGRNLTEAPVIKYSANAVITVPGVLAGPPLAEVGLGVPQPGADDRQIPWVIPLPEGGGSSINAGAFCRGTNELYSKWEKIAGSKWSVERILEIFKKLENYRGETTNSHARGFHGPLTVSQVLHPSKLARTFTKAIIRATDFPFVLDYNDPKTPIGNSSQFQYTQTGPDRKLRVSSASAFLNEDVITESGHGVDGRKLRVLFKSVGLKTIWKGKRAIGVKFLQDGKTKKVYASKGVVVCCGLRSSPFLMHSGIGPQALLKSLKIPVKFDNPFVGQGLADQPSLRMLFSSDPEDGSLNPNGIFGQVSWLPVPGGDKNKRELRIATVAQVPGTTVFILDLCQP
ncbi:MAG TPA: GMC family oxidoreductase N-terminal domain-containing protein [Chlamydiales bacterium]|nr:GMC family oxidoreductase N-terminal domain-containing protein [Chlamydiales bacterium]